jgi:2-polyprenyl-6-methoxyphenol hydroxylase-like FAD-dependent oxidoreductase
LRSVAKDLLPPQISAVLKAVRQPILSPIFDLECPRLVFGRAVLLGDSAFVVRPHVGTGVTKAALDAQALTDALAQAGNCIDEALARYNSERVQFGHWLVARGRYLGSYLEASGGQPHHDARVDPQRSMESYLREYGAGGVIDGGTIGSRCA